MLYMSSIVYAYVALDYQTIMVLYAVGCRGVKETLFTLSQMADTGST